MLHSLLLPSRLVTPLDLPLFFASLSLITLVIYIPCYYSILLLCYLISTLQDQNSSLSFRYKTQPTTNTKQTSPLGGTDSCWCVVPGHCDPVSLASRDSFGRALLRVYKSICLAICEVVSKSAGSFPASRHQVVPLGTGGKSLGQVECDVPFTCVSILSGVELEA